MDRSERSRSVFSATPSGPWVRAALASVATVVVLGVGASASWASTTTINFETPAIPGTASPQFGPLVTDQYESEGVTFLSPSSTPVTSPAGVGFSQPYVYRDTANAHSGKQVLYAYECSGEACSFGDGYGAMFAQLASPTTEVELYAGANGGGSVEIAGYNAAGVQVAHQYETAGTKDDKHMQVTSSTADIAYFSVARSGYGSLEIDDLSFVVPAVPPPPSITLGPSSGTAAYPGASASLAVDVQRFDGADDAVNLTVSGLPTGVTLTGGTTIPAGSDTTTLRFSVSSSAPLVTDAKFTISATSADVSAPPPLTDEFSIDSPGAPVTVEAEAPGSYIPASTAYAPVAPCSIADVTVLVGSNPLVTSDTHLALSTSGDTDGLTSSLSSDTVGPTHGGEVFVTLTVQRTTSENSGNAYIKITGTNGSAHASATVVIQRTGLVAQGLYVTQGSQTDFGLLPSSGVGTSGTSYQGVQLVAGKTTVVRLYADAADTPAGQPGPPPAQLYGYKNGHPLPGSPLEPDYGPSTDGTAPTPETTLPDANAWASGDFVLDSELESNNNAYTFTLPYSWVGGYLDYPYYPPDTTIKLVGQVQPYQSTGVTASCAGSESYTLNKVKFTQVANAATEPQIFPVPVTVKGVYPPPPAEVFNDLNAVTPLPDGGIIYYPYTGDVDITSIASTTQGPCGLSPTVTGVYKTDPLNSSTSESAGNACSDIKDYGVLQAVENFVQNYDDGALNGPHVVGVNLGVARGLTNNIPGQYSVVDGTPDYRPLTSVSHEVFHQFGFAHASAACGGNGVSWPPDQLGELDGVGLNTTSEPYQFIANGSPDFPASTYGKTVQATAFDFMSYCAHAGGDDPNTWTAPRNWTQLISILQSGSEGGGFAADEASAARAQKARAGGPLAAPATVDPARVSVTGFVTRSGVQIATVGPQVGPPGPRGSSVDTFTLTARGSHGQVLASVPMAATTGGHFDGATGPIPFQQISAEVPAGGIDSIQVVDAGTVMASRKRPAKAPLVRVVAPATGARVGAGRRVLVRWRATNPEHLALTAIVDYSRDGGRTWRPIFDGPNKGHALLQSFFLTASRHARVRVRISDGFNQSDARSGVFIALGAPPQVTILTRLIRRMHLAGDARLQLTGQAVDQTAQVLTGRRLRWSDGPFLLGTGSAISAGPLPAGINHIRLVARDPSGRAGSATLNVIVNPVALPFLKLTIPKLVSRRSKRLKLRAGASIPATLTIGRRRFQLGNPRTISVPIAPGRGQLLLHLSVIADGITTPFAARITR